MVHRVDDPPVALIDLRGREAVGDERLVVRATSRRPSYYEFGRVQLRDVAYEISGFFQADPAGQFRPTKKEGSRRFGQSKLQRFPGLYISGRSSSTEGLAYSVVTKHVGLDMEQDGRVRFVHVFWLISRYHER